MAELRGVNLVQINQEYVNDTIAPEASVRHAMDLLTGSVNVQYRVCPGGHLGVLTGRQARTTTWPTIDAWMSDLDAAG